MKYLLKSCGFLSYLCQGEDVITTTVCPLSLTPYLSFILDVDYPKLTPNQRREFRPVHA